MKWLKRITGTGVTEPGHVRGRHFTTYVDEVKALKRSKKLDQAEKLLGELVEATEAEDRVDGNGVAPWYYEQLAVIYRQRKDYASEVEILERFAEQKHAVGVSPPKLIERLKKARELLKDSKNTK